MCNELKILIIDSYNRQSTDISKAFVFYDYNRENHKTVLERILINIMRKNRISLSPARIGFYQLILDYRKLNGPWTRVNFAMDFNLRPSSSMALKYFISCFEREWIPPYSRLEIDGRPWIIDEMPDFFDSIGKTLVNQNTMITYTRWCSVSTKSLSSFSAMIKKYGLKKWFGMIIIRVADEDSSQTSPMRAFLDFVRGLNSPAHWFDELLDAVGKRGLVEWLYLTIQDPNMWNKQLKSLLGFLRNNPLKDGVYLDFFPPYSDDQIKERRLSLPLIQEIWRIVEDQGYNPSLVLGSLKDCRERLIEQTLKPSKIWQKR